MKKSFYHFVFFFLFSVATQAGTTYNSTGNGDWLTPGRWTPTGAPTNGASAANRNIIIIQAGHTITISGDDIALSNVIVYVYGVLNMDNVGLDYANLNITGTGAGVIIQPGGKIDESSLLDNFLNIRVNGVVVWNGSSTGDLTAGGVAISLPIGVNDPLPVDLIDWKATVMNNNVTTSWTSSSESNNSFFTVEESTDGENFAAIETIASKGNSTTLQTYNYSFTTTGIGTLYYRLKQTDLDGAYSYSQIIKITVADLSAQTWSVYPNPIIDRTFAVQSHSTVNELTSVSILDMQSGREIFRQEFSAADAGMVKVSLPENVLSGIYLLSIQQGEEVESKPIMIQ